MFSQHPKIDNRMKTIFFSNNRQILKLLFKEIYIRIYFMNPTEMTYNPISSNPDLGQLTMKCFLVRIGLNWVAHSRNVDSKCDNTYLSLYIAKQQIS